MAGGIMLAAIALPFTTMTQNSAAVLLPDPQTIAVALEGDAQIVSDTQLQDVLVGQPQDVQDEVLRINDDAGSLSLQVALLVPLLACLSGCSPPSAWRAYQTSSHHHPPRA
jgi:hypothetical protein